MRYRSITPLNAGFVLPTAIFLLVVLASIAAFMLHLSGASQAAGTLDVQGARAYQAARVGIERGLWEVLQNSANCPATTQTITLSGMLNGFTVNWTCSKTSFTENATARGVYQITSTASYNGGTNNDRVERQLVATTERAD